MGFPCGSVVKNPPANTREAGSIPGPGRCPEGWNDNPLWYSCLGIFSPGQRSLEGSYCPWGHKRARHNLATELQQQIYRMYNELMEIHQKRGENPKYKLRQSIGTESNRKETPKSQAFEEMFISNMRNENLVQQWCITLFHWSLTLPLVNKSIGLDLKMQKLAGEAD